MMPKLLRNTVITITFLVPCSQTSVMSSSLDRLLFFLSFYGPFGSLKRTIYFVVLHLNLALFCVLNSAQFVPPGALRGEMEEEQEGGPAVISVFVLLVLIINYPAGWIYAFFFPVHSYLWVWSGICTQSFINLSPPCLLVVLQDHT